VVILEHHTFVIDVLLDIETRTVILVKDNVLNVNVKTVLRKKLTHLLDDVLIVMVSLKMKLAITIISKQYVKHTGSATNAVKDIYKAVKSMFASSVVIVKQNLKADSR